MPEVVVFAVEGRSSEQKKKLMKDITDAVVSNFNVNPEVVVVSVVETPKQNKSRGGIPFDEQ